MATTVGCRACGQLACVCQILREHDDGCDFRRSATCAVPVACEHGRDCCPVCDRCTCTPERPRNIGDGRVLGVTTR